MTLTHVYSGKVRDVYGHGDERLLMVASDRISAFDVVLAEPIPDKGRVLTAMTVFWLEQLADLAPSHLVSADPADFPSDARRLEQVDGRAMLVRRAEMLPIECIVRGYLSGSAWKEYRQSGTVHGVRQPAGLQESDRLPDALFTPSTKATEGHDVNIGFDDAVAMVGAAVAEEARDVCLGAYRRGAEWAAARGIIIADTKFELGFIDGRLALCDEVLTPDSSRFWPAGEWAPGSTPPSFDKQPVRDCLEATGWDKSPPPPPLPDAVVKATGERYRAAYEQITGLRLADWYGGGDARGMRFHALVEVRLRAGIADPQGATIERALPALGFESVEGVRVGKAIRFDVDAVDEAEARAEIDELCRRLLANPVIEEADVHISSEPGSMAAGGRAG